MLGAAGQRLGRAVQQHLLGLMLVLLEVDSGKPAEMVTLWLLYG